MQPNIKQGLLLAYNSGISDEQLQHLIRSDLAITDVYHLDNDYFARGKFAHVRRIQHKQTGIRYAAKTMKKRRLRVGDVTDEIKHEIRVLMTCHPCPHIVNLHEIYETKTDFTLVLELAEGGELQQVLDELETGVDEQRCRTWLTQIVKGVRFLHQNRIAHLDIKPQNILLANALHDDNGQPHLSSAPSKQTSNDGSFVKLCDFGISRLIEDSCEVKEIMGTVDYMPPEIIQYEPISLAADMWSIGVVAYVLLSGHSPFGGDNKQQTYSNITSLVLEFPDELFGSVSDSAKDFIQKLLVRDPKKRMNCDQCLEHEWLAANDAGLTKQPEPEPNLNDNLIILISSADSDSECDSKSTKSSSSSSNTSINDQTSSTITISSSIGSLDVDVVDDDDGSGSGPSNNDNNTVTPDRDSGLGGNICDNNKEHDNGNDLHNKTEIEEEMDVNDNCNKENLPQSSKPSSYNHHKRLSSDIFPDRKLIAIVSNCCVNSGPGGRLTKKYTSDNSMISADTQSDKLINGDDLMVVKGQDNQNSVLDHQETRINKSDDNSGSSTSSPPSTPSKKFYLSVDDDCYNYNYLNNHHSSPTRRIRSVSMERLYQHQHAHSPSPSSCSMTSCTVHHHTPNRACSFSHRISTSRNNHDSMLLTMPIATIETHTTTTTTTTSIDNYSTKRILNHATSTMITKTTINANSPSNVNTTLASNGTQHSFHIQIKHPFFQP